MANPARTARKPALRLKADFADSERMRKAISAKTAGFLSAAGVKGHHLRQISPKAFRKAMARPKMRPRQKAVKRAPARRVL